MNDKERLRQRLRALRGEPEPLPKPSEEEIAHGVAQIRTEIARRFDTAEIARAHALNQQRLERYERKWHIEPYSGPDHYTNALSYHYTQTLTAPARHPDESDLLFRERLQRHADEIRRASEYTFKPIHPFGQHTPTFQAEYLCEPMPPAPERAQENTKQRSFMDKIRAAVPWKR